MVTKVSRGYLSQLRIRYRKVAKPQKIIILDEFTKTTGYERQHAGKLLRGRYKHQLKKIYRPHRVYTKIKLRFMYLLGLRGSGKVFHSHF